MTKAELVALVRRVKPKKSLGQNFLIEPKLLERIAAQVSGPVLEIGCGPGNLTWFLARRADKVVAVEIDPEALEIACSTVPDAEFIGEDARTVIPRLGGSFTIVSNLPYKIYHDLLLALFEAPFEIRAMVLMVQEDVYARLAAESGSKAYGPLSVICRTLGSFRKLARAGRAMFWPPPQVDSVVFECLRKRRHQDLHAVERRLKHFFSFRGRKLRHALPGVEPADARVETLPPETLFELATRPDAPAVDR